jgi:hypothetical protein
VSGHGFDAFEVVGIQIQEIKSRAAEISVETLSFALNIHKL